MLSFEMGNIRTMVDVAGIAILYAHLIQCCELRVRKELEAVQNVLQNQYAQYKQSKESIFAGRYQYLQVKPILRKSHLQLVCTAVFHSFQNIFYNH